MFTSFFWEPGNVILRGKRHFAEVIAQDRERETILDFLGGPTQSLQEGRSQRRCDGSSGPSNVATGQALRQPVELERQGDRFCLRASLGAVCSHLVLSLEAGADSGLRSQRMQCGV